MSIHNEEFMDTQDVQAATLEEMIEDLIESSDIPPKAVYEALLNIIHRIEVEDGEE